VAGVGVHGSAQAKIPEDEEDDDDGTDEPDDSIHDFHPLLALEESSRAGGRKSRWLRVIFRSRGSRFGALSNIRALFVVQQMAGDGAGGAFEGS